VTCRCSGVGGRHGWWMVVEKEMRWRVGDAKSSIGKHRHSLWKRRGENDTYTVIFACYIMAVWLSGKMLLLFKLLMECL
jgi:hypothetical protein